MDVSPDRYVACSLFPFIHEYNDFRFNESNPNYKRITELRDKMNPYSIPKTLTDKGNTSSSKSHKMSKKEKKVFRILVAKLMDSEEDIKMFHLIVQLVEESESVYKRKDRYRWEYVSNILIKYGYSSKMYSTSNCMNKFFNWSEWYAQVYFRIILFKLHSNCLLFSELLKTERLFGTQTTGSL